MKAQFLKIAGVKTEQEFYKLFPSEASFFKKHPEAQQSIRTAQNGVDLNSNGIPDEHESMDDIQNGMQRYGQASSIAPLGSVGIKPYNYQLPTPGMSTKDMSTNLQADHIKSPNLFSKIGGAQGLADGASSVMQGFEMIKEEKQERDVANQFNEYSKVALRASGTRPEQMQRRYVRPEDNITSSDELFPINGVGTNILAKNGKQIAQNGTEMFSGNNFDYGSMGAMGSQLYNGISGKQMNGGSKIGGSLGKLAGTALGGPLGGMIGEIGGDIIGGAFDSIGDDTKRYQESSQRNVDGMMMNTNMRALQNQNRAYAENGAEISDLENSGELQTLWGGETEQLSQNPYHGETVMFRGQSHKESDNQGNSGIGFKYGNNHVEAERGEPAAVLTNKETGEDKLHIFGDLYIPKFAYNTLQDPKAHNKKFKNYVADLSKEENKLNRIVDTSKKLMDLSNSNSTAVDKLHLNSGIVKHEGAMIRLKDIANKKEQLSELQNLINNTAEEHGLVAADLAKGKIKRAKENTQSLKEAMNGYSMPKAAYGMEVSEDPEGSKDPNRHGLSTWAGNKVTNKGQFAARFSLEDFNTIADNIGYTGNNVKDFQQALYNIPEARKIIDAESIKHYGKVVKGDKLIDGKLGVIFEGPGLKNIKKAPAYQRAADFTNPVSANTATIPANKQAAAEDKNIDTVQYRRNPYIDAFNQVAPYLRPSNATPLDGNQLLGEMYGMQSNQVEPVQSQRYNPQLRTPYDISLQDQLNEVTASERGYQKMNQYNPEVQDQMAGMAYANKSKILAEQFRANQGMKEQVYSGNIQTLNDAQLKNLDINDQQYTRQEQAKSNTKAINQSILNSISSKYSQNKLENRTLGIQENMYNYRFDKSGRAINMNGIHQPNVPVVYNKEGKATGKIITDKNGNVTYQKFEDAAEAITPIAPSPSIPSIATPPFANTNTSSYYENEEGANYDQETNQGRPQFSQRKNGGVITNGSIFKSLK